MTDIETTQTDTPSTDGRADVIAVRKTCDVEGTGLSHYVLMDKARRTAD